MYGVIRCTCEGLGIMALMKDLGIEDATARVHMDANAAKGIIERPGVSKVRHLDCDVIWLQQQQLRRAMPLIKIKGIEPPAGIVAKHRSSTNADASRWSPT